MRDFGFEQIKISNLRNDDVLVSLPSKIPGVFAPERGLPNYLFDSSHWCFLYLQIEAIKTNFKSTITLTKD